jgi:hypothetical protein
MLPQTVPLTPDLFVPLLSSIVLDRGPAFDNGPLEHSGGPQPIGASR